MASCALQASRTSYLEHTQHYVVLSPSKGGTGLEGAKLLATTSGKSRIYKTGHNTSRFNSSSISFFFFFPFLFI